MNRWTRRLMLAGLFGVILVAGGLAAQGTKHAAAPPDATTRPANERHGREASCLLRLTYRLSDESVESHGVGQLLRSSVVLRPAAQEVRGLPLDRLDDVVDVDVTLISHRESAEGSKVFETQILRLEVSVATEIPEAQTKADQLLWALSKRLEAVLAERGAEQVSSLRERLARAREAYGQVHERLSKLQELQQRLYVDTWQADLSREGMLAEYRSLQKERVDLEAKLAAMNARQSALEEQVARIGREAARLAGEDPVALELEKVVKLREQKLERMKELVAAGKVTAAEAADVEEGVAQARAELAKQRQVASQAAGGALLGDLNKEVVSLMVNIAEAKARHEFVNQALDRYQIPELQDRADRYDREVAGELPGVRDAAERALAEQTRAGEELSSYRPPAVVVLGAASDETGTPASK